MLITSTQQHSFEGGREGRGGSEVGRGVGGGREGGRGERVGWDGGREREGGWRREEGRRAIMEWVNMAWSVSKKEPEQSWVNS